MNPQPHFSNVNNSVWRRQDNDGENSDVTDDSASDTATAPESSIRSSSMSELEYSCSDDDEDDSSPSEYERVIYPHILAPQAHTLPRPVWATQAEEKSPEPQNQGNQEVQNAESLENSSETEKWVLCSSPSADWTYAQLRIDETINNAVNCSWPPAPNSIWYDPLRHIDTEASSSLAPFTVGTPWYLCNPTTPTVNGRHFDD